MILKEFPSITKEGNTVVNKSGEISVTADFVKQMSERGNETIVYYVNNAKNIDPKTPEDEIVNGVCWSENFTSEDMIYMIMAYADMSFTPKQKKLFAKRIENVFLESELYNEAEAEAEEYDDDFDDD